MATERVITFAYLTNWQYGGYSYHEPVPERPPELWVRGMVDYADPENVLEIAEKGGLREISLAGPFWKNIGYEGWGQKVSIEEARDALKKAREFVFKGVGL